MVSTFVRATASPMFRAVASFWNEASYEQLTGLASIVKHQNQPTMQSASVHTWIVCPRQLSKMYMSSRHGVVGGHHGIKQRALGDVLDHRSPWKPTSKAEFMLRRFR